MKITRMNGLGNRFAIIDGRGHPLANIEQLAQRIDSIDQLLVLEEALAGGDLRMEIYNRDGSLAEACGNGARCVAWLEMDVLKRDRLALETRSGLLDCRRRGDLIEVDMGAPRFGWREIPLSCAVADSSHIIIEEAPQALGAGFAVNIGNPHIIFFPERLDALDIEEIGRLLEHHKLFPQGVNISFVVIENKGLRVKVWERGAGATKACGTAACAALVASCRRFVNYPRSCPVALEGGVLEIDWRKQDDHVLMLGAVAWENEERINVA